MLSCSGVIGVVSDEVVVQKGKNGSNFLEVAVVSADPRHEGPAHHHHYRLNLFVADADLEEARSSLTKGKIFQLRFGQWSANKVEREGKEPFVANKLSAAWKNLSPINYVKK